MSTPTGPPDRRLVDAAVVRRLVARQFPRWRDLPVRPVSPGGWDNQTFRLGERLSVRLPTAASYALSVDKEHRWLPVLAPRLPLPVSVPVARGEPDEDFPHPWSVYSWLDGEPVGRDNIADLAAFADALAGFVVALRQVDPRGGPEPGLHNWFRGGPLRVYDEQTRRAIEELAGRVPADEATWARGRGWALWKALITYGRDPGAALVVDRILADHARTGREP